MMSVRLIKPEICNFIDLIKFYILSLMSKYSRYYYYYWYGNYIKVPKSMLVCYNNKHFYCSINSMKNDNGYIRFFVKNHPKNGFYDYSSLQQIEFQHCTAEKFNKIKAFL